MVEKMRRRNDNEMSKRKPVTWSAARTKRVSHVHEPSSNFTRQRLRSLHKNSDPCDFKQHAILSLFRNQTSLFSFSLENGRKPFRGHVSQ